MKKKTFCGCKCRNAVPFQLNKVVFCIHGPSNSMKRRAIAFQTRLGCTEANLFVLLRLIFKEVAWRENRRRVFRARWAVINVGAASSGEGSRRNVLALCAVAAVNTSCGGECSAPDGGHATGSAAIQSCRRSSLCLSYRNRFLCCCGWNIFFFALRCVKKC